MNYNEAIDFLFNSLPVWEQKGAGAYKPGLERIGAFVDIMGLGGECFPVPFSSKMRSCKACDGAGRGVYRFVNDESGVERNAADAYFSRKRFVHVAGTNGKGSVCHMLAAVMRSAGFRTGLFTSPHLVDFRERIRVDGEMIPEEAVVEFTERWHEQMVAFGQTFFEMATAMALWWFERAGCDIAVIETGLGGRLDSTNIITPAVSVITNIGLEHTQYLGDTIAAIAAEKAGIIKPGVPVVIGETDPESEPVFRARAAELGSPIVFADRGYGRVRAGDYKSDLKGDYQQKNIATVLATVEVLRGTLTISEDAVREGIGHAAALTGLAGRWQVVGRDPLVVLDTAHNAHGLALVSRQIEHRMESRPNGDLYMVLGFAGDKDLDAIIPLLPVDARYILTRAATPRAMPTEELAARFAARGIARGNIETVETVPKAVARALSFAGADDMVFIGGSNFVVGEALAAFTNVQN